MVDTVTIAGNSDVRGPGGEVIRELRGSELPGPADASAAASQMAWLNQTYVPIPLRSYPSYLPPSFLRCAIAVGQLSPKAGAKLCWFSL